MKFHLLPPTFYLLLLVGCTIAPTGNHLGQATISESGRADSGAIHVTVLNGVTGWTVEPSFRANYVALLATYGGRISPPNPDPLTGWDLTPRADGLLWCNDKVISDYGLMNFLHEQDVKLQTP